MTVEHTADIDRKVYIASVGQTVFQFPIKNFGVKIYCDALTKIEGIHWTATGYGEDAGITVTFVTPMVGGEKVLIILDTPLTQTTDFVTGGRFVADELEDTVDVLHLQVRETRGMIGRAITFEDTASSVHDSVKIPAMTGNEGKVLKVNSTADGVVWGTDLTSGEGIELPIESSDVNHTQPYTGSFNIGLDRAMKRLLKITAQDFSLTQLLRDGSFNSQSQHQAMMDSANAGEGTPHLLRGTWRWDSEVVADYRGKSTTTSTRGFDIVGEGIGAVVININHGGNGLRILSTPGTTSWHLFSQVYGFRMIDLTPRTAKAIYLDGAAYMHMHNIAIYNAAYAIDGVDVLSSTFSELYTNGVLYGIRLQRVTSSRPNALLFEGNTFGAYNYGMLLIEPNTVGFQNNTWEGIGKLGEDVNRFACEIQGAGTIGGGISWYNDHFEGTDGLCDIRINAGAADCTYGVNACTMQKTLPDEYPQHNIRIDQDAEDGWVRLSVRDTKFSSHNGYVPSTSNRVIHAYTANEKFILSEDNNFYQNQVEMPAQARANGETFAEALVNGSLAGPITPAQQKNFDAVTKSGTGHYVLPFKRPGRFATKIPVVSAVNAAPLIAQPTNYDENSVTVKIWDITGAATDSWFAIRVSD